RIHDQRHRIPLGLLCRGDRNGSLVLPDSLGPTQPKLYSGACRDVNLLAVTGLSWIAAELQSTRRDQRLACFLCEIGAYEGYTCCGDWADRYGQWDRLAGADCDRGWCLDGPREVGDRLIGKRVVEDNRLATHIYREISLLRRIGWQVFNLKKQKPCPRGCSGW